MDVDYNDRYKFESTYNDDRVYKYNAHMYCNEILLAIYKNYIFNMFSLLKYILHQQFYSKLYQLALFLTFY